MPFVPHNDDDRKAMLEAIGAASVEELFDEIPAALLDAAPPRLPPALGEMEVARLMGDRARSDGNWLCFIGAGAYEHHIPSAVWQIAARGEFYTAYTPYQPEASQGTLQVIWEYQSMMAALTGLEVSNASLYDGASALAEAVLMAVRAHPSSRRVLIPAAASPLAVRAVRTLVANQGIELVSLPFDPATGTTDPAALPEGDWAAVVVQHPNFFGMLEPVDALAQRARALGARVIACVNPVSLAVLKPPGQWGEAGADIAVGEGQPLGAPLSGGGPYFGFMCCRRELVRQMPGRLVGRTADRDGRPGFVLTLQAREQHIRRGKATSNICTNQGLMATAAAIHMALLGPRGMAAVASRCHAATVELVELLTRIPGVERAFAGALFHEAVLRLPTAVEPVLRALRAQGILGGLDLTPHYPELGHALLVCATETKSGADLERYAEQMERILSRRREGPPCPARN